MLDWTVKSFLLFRIGSQVLTGLVFNGRVITKGYRIEKRLVPLYGRPLRLLCEECQMSFTVDDDQSVERRRSELDSPVPAFDTA